MFEDYNAEHGYSWKQPYILYYNDRPKFEQTIRDWVKAYAKIEDLDQLS